MPSTTDITRRVFLGASAALSASCFAAQVASAAPQRTADSGTKPVSAQAPSAAPQVLGALPDLSSQARPFTVAERQARIERAKQLMAAAKIDAIVLANSTSSSVYFADLRLNGGERLWALVIPARAKPFLVCPAFEEGRARELLDAGPLGKDAEVLV